MPGLLKAKVNGQWVATSSASGGGGGGSEEVFVGPNQPTSTAEIWYDTDAPGITADDLRWNSSWGIVAESTVTTGNQTTTGSVDVTGLAATFTPIVGRKYRYSVKIDITTTAPGDVVVLSINETTGASAQIDRHTGRLGGTASETWAWSTRTETFTTTTPVTRKTVLVRASGTGTIATQCDTSFPAKFLVEDMGPVTGVIPTAMPTTDRWNTAWGIVGVGSFIGGSAYPIPAAITKINPDLVVSTVVGRRYRMVLQVRLVLAITAGQGVNFLPRGPGVGASSVDLWMSSPGYGYVRAEVLFTGQGSSGAYYWDANPGSATSFYMDTMSNFYIEDIGPISGALPVVDPTPAWIRPTFENGWEDYGYPGWERAAYRKIGDVVTLRGLVKRAAGDLNQQPMFTLPIGYRPPAPLIFNVNSSLTTYANARYDVQPTGACYVNDGRPGYSGFTSISGVSFSVTP